MWSTFKAGRHLLKLDAAVQRDIHELFTRSAGDLLDHWFETDAVRRCTASTPWLAITRALTRRQRPCAVASSTTLAPKGAHVASLYCQYFAYKLPGGRAWHQERARATDLNFSTVESYAPNFRASVVGYSALSPVDLEEKLGLAGGGAFHGAPGLDQPWAAHPMLGCDDSRTPVKGLYLRGAGAHPDSGVTGIPGHDAAREMMRDGVSPVRGPNI